MVCNRSSDISCCLHISFTRSLASKEDNQQLTDLTKKFKSQFYFRRANLEPKKVTVTSWRYAISIGNAESWGIILSKCALQINKISEKL